MLKLISLWVLLLSGVIFVFPVRAADGIAVMASPQRYDYIAQKIKDGELTNKSATKKNITKAVLMADEFVESIKERNSLDN